MLTLKGKTVRGKNRIRRGGDNWTVIDSQESNFMLVESVSNPRELFWMKKHNDPNVEVVNETAHQS